MIPNRKFIGFLMIILLFINSCVTKKDLTYLRYAGKTADNAFSQGDNQPSVTPSSYKIMSYDNLYIRVITPDPQWSVLFNTLPVGAGGAVTEESAGLFGYPVDGDGMIEIPFVGKVEARGKTLSDLKAELVSIFKNYLTDAAITVRLVNNYVSIIGEVNTPGRYHITKDRLTVFEALSMAGDMSEFGNRSKVQLIRPSPYGPVVKEFSLADRSILSSEYYYVMPNDIIYVMPARGRSFEMNSPIWNLFLMTLTSALGVIGFLRTL